MFLITFNLFSQIGINTVDPKATFHITHNDPLRATGFIPPIVSLEYLMNNDDLYTEELRGSIVYVNDLKESTTVDGINSTNQIVQKGYYYFDGGTWTLFVVPESITIPNEPWKNDITGLDARDNDENIVQDAQVGIGFNLPIHPSAQLEIQSSNKGLLIPRLSTNQRNEITDVPNSLLIYNTDTDCFDFYKKNKWRSLCGDIGESVVIVPDCNSAVIKGEYKAGQVLGNDNYFEITVNVVEPGDYTILVSDIDVNSTFFFQKDGKFPTAGEFTIQIPAVGTPTIAGNKTFKVIINDELTACQATVNVSAASVVINTITYVSSDDLFKGENSTGKEMKITASVGTGGSFNFQTNSVNGLSYSANNITIASNTNNHPVTLKANGNPPTQAGTFQYNITGTGYSGSATGSVIVIQNDADISSANCNQAKVRGTYKLNTTLTASNYIEIPVIANTTGTYNINITNATAGFSFTASGNINATGTSTIKVPGTGIPTKSGRLPFTVDINGKTCTLYIDVISPIKNVLMVGTRTDQVKKSLQNTLNFGPKGDSKIERFDIDDRGKSITAGQLKSAINSQGIQIIIIGWYWQPNAQITAILADFVKNKKGFVFITESERGGEYIGTFLGQLYNRTVTMTRDEYGVYTAKFNSSVPTDNPYLDGVFGNIRGKYLRADDAESWIGVLPADMPTGLKSLIDLPPNGGSGTGKNSARYTQLYDDGIFMISDCGMLNRTGTDYGSFSPIRLATTATNGNNYNGSSVAKRTIQGSEVANWVLFGNAMDHIIKYIDENYIPSYQVQ